MLSRRTLIASFGGVTCSCAVRGAVAASSLPAMSTMPMAAHERAMRQAIAEAHGNPVYPFGAAIVRAASGAVAAKGVNTTTILHGEIAAMNDYVARHGNGDWSAHILYTTGEPCSMCMSALVWAGIGGVVFGSSIDGIRRAGIDQIDITAKSVIDASPFWHGTLLGGVLQTECDQLFMQRKRQ
jgi:tRNA(adenine34) deaminase